MNEITRFTNLSVCVCGGGEGGRDGREGGRLLGVQKYPKIEAVFMEFVASQSAFTLRQLIGLIESN